MSNESDKPAKYNGDMDLSQIMHDVRLQLHTLTSVLQVIRRFTGNEELYIGGTEITFFHEMMWDAAQKSIAILDMALPERIREENAPFSLVSLLRGILEAISVLAENNGYSLMYSSLEECILPRGKTDASRVLYNIITNALTHTPRNSVVSIEMRKEGEDYVRVSVSDQGFGLTKEQRLILTGPYPLPQSTEHMIGLRSTRTQIEALGGYITVEDLEPVGMKVSIFFRRG